MGLRHVTNVAALTRMRQFQTVTGHPGHNHFYQRALGRRAFLGTIATVTGATMVPNLLGKRPFSTVDPRPIPGGNEFLAPNPTLFHINPPIPDVELSAITDFNGFLGATELQGLWTKVSGPGPAPSGTLNWDSDMRFMVGEYIGVDNEHHQGTFAFVWIDLYEDQVGPFTNQTHDFNPGISDSGLFWTTPISSADLTVNPGAGNAAMHVKDLQVKDYGNFVISLLKGPFLEATLSYQLEWNPPKSRQRLRDTVNDFVIDLVQTSATMTWVASSAGNTYQSLTVNPPLFAAIGHERNGVFFS
jgi:hypothetical protein